MKTRKYLGTFFSLGFLLVVGLAWLNRLAIYDQLRLFGYDAPASIAQLASDTTMNDKTKNLFYAQHPALEEKTSFNENCPQGEQTIVLGCYVSRQGIYIYDVDEPKLAGIKQVTAAHELLHAAYERLSSKERNRINSLLNDAYRNLSDDRIKKTIEQYRAAGADVDNELHSILGTEVRTLSADLEIYYKMYFDDRLIIVTYSENYEQAFENIKNQVKSLDAELESLKVQVEANEQNLTTQANDLEAERRSLDNLLVNQQYEAYNAAVPGFNANVRAYNALVEATKQLIDDYNAKLEVRNNLALQEQELYKAIDSRINPQETE